MRFAGLLIASSWDSYIDCMTSLVTLDEHAAGNFRKSVALSQIVFSDFSARFFVILSL